MRKILHALLLAAVLAVPSSHAEVPTLPFDDVKTGMKGEGRTVFSGVAIETFEVEILGKLPNIGPHKNLILARCSGGPLAETGVLSGMSGSPIYIDGKLIGALAYSWGFTTDAIAGITPIDEMFEIAHEPDFAAPTATRGGGVTSSDLLRLSSPAEIPGYLTGRMDALAPSPAAGLPIRVPVSVAGVGSAGLARIEEDFQRAGFTAVQGGGAGVSPDASPPIEPGSAIGLKLVRGDVDMTATGTVTWVDRGRVLALGHPLFGLGAVDLPLTGARVEALLPSLYQSARLATPLSEVGALSQDRSAGVLGRLGSTSRMIPIRLQLTGSGGMTHNFSFDVADDPLLAPVLLYNSLNAILADSERTFGNITVRVEPGSVIKLEGREDVELDNLFAGQTAPAYATGTSAFILYLLLNNNWSPPSIAGINVLLSYDQEPRTATLRRFTLDRYRVRPGETVESTLVLSPFRGPDLVLTRKIDVPPETPPGRLTLHVGGALAVSRAERTDEPLFPRDLDQLIWLINNLRRNDRIYIVASQEDTGVYVGGTRLPNLPPSVTSILTRPRTTGNLAVIPQRGVLEESIPTGYMVEGLARVHLEVETP
jgi:hypothetical protein